MIIINCGLPKAGTTLVFQYQLELLKRFGRGHAQSRWRSFNGSYFVPAIGIRHFLFLIWTSICFGDICIKTHQKPGRYLKLLVFLGLAKCTFMVRDPRDIVLSLIDHAEKIRMGKKKKNSIASIQGFDDAIVFAAGTEELWKAWINYGKAMFY